jgi:mutator protein MutT
MIKRGAGIFFTDGKKTLILKRNEEGKNKGKWDFPGGKANPKESFLEAAKREAREECGLDVVPGNNVDSIKYNDNQKEWTTFIFKIKESFKVNLSHEHVDHKWVKLEDLSDFDLHPKIDRDLSNILKKARKKVANQFLEWFVFRSLVN